MKIINCNKAQINEIRIKTRTGREEDMKAEEKFSFIQEITRAAPNNYFHC